MDTLRNSFRVVGAAFMNSEMVYSFLMGMGWFFLVTWAVALLVACASVFRQDQAAVDLPSTSKARNGKLMVGASRRA